MPDRRAELIGVGLCATAALLWALSATIARQLFDDGASPLELTELRAWVAAAAFLILARWERKTRWWSWPSVALGIALAAVNISYFAAIERLPVAIAVIIQYTAPALVVLYELTVERRRPTVRTVVALVGVIAGVSLISDPLSASGAALDPTGLVYAAISAFGFAGYNLLAARVEPMHGGVGAHARGFVVAGLIWALVQAPQGTPATVLHLEMLPEIAMVTVLGTVAAFGVYAQGIRRIGAAHATITSTLEPVAVALFAWVMLDQSLDAFQITGAAIVLASIVSLQPRRDAAADAPHPHG